MQPFWSNPPPMGALNHPYRCSRPFTKESLAMALLPAGSFLGRVYQISAPGCSQVYVGSTRLTLARRLSIHYRDMRSHARGSHGFVSSFDVLKHPGARIDLLEEDEFDLPQLREREAHWIRNLDSVNRAMPGRSAKESTRLSKSVEVHCQICNKKVRRGLLHVHRLTRSCMNASYAASAFRLPKNSSGKQESPSWSSASSSSLCPSSVHGAPSPVH
jgi:hypothetical protein